MRKLKKISYEKLIENHHFRDYLEEVRYIQDLLKEGKIKPVKNSPSNGKKPALPMNFWLIKNHEDEEKIQEELAYRLATAIDAGYYRKHPEIYREERNDVIALSDYLENEKEKLHQPISENERSFDIWKREKFLTREGGKKLLKHCGLTKEHLNCYETSEPVAYYTKTKQVPQNMLVIENLDTFYSMRKHLEEHQEILQMEVGTVFYGGGKKIIGGFGDFRKFMETYMKHPDNQILYFGDLDYEGIGMYESFEKRYRDSNRIFPFREAYLAMIEKAKQVGFERLPDMKEGQNHNINGSFYNCFDEKTVMLMKEILERGKYIPQEILTISDF